MIEYEPGKWHISFICRVRGSVFPKACAWAVPAALVSVVLSQWVVERFSGSDGIGVGQVWTGYNFVLGFLVVFRTQQAYARFWEGATILQQVRGEWFNAVSSCFAFCSTRAEKEDDVEKFQQLLIRLISLLYCSALQQVAVLSDEAFEILDLEGISEQSLEYLSTAPEKCLVILQWIQRLIFIAAEDLTITAPPPLLTRVYQELSNGIVNVVNAQKITDIIFPFPYAQMVTVMLIATTLITPIFTAYLMEYAVSCGVLTFITVFSYWCMNYIAAEIEMPFGEDLNDLPIAQLQEGLNMALRMLLDDCAKHPPEYTFDVVEHCYPECLRCPFQLITNVQHKLWDSCHYKLRNVELQNIAKKRNSMVRQRTETMRFKNDTEADDEKGVEVVEALPKTRTSTSSKTSNHGEKRFSIRSVLRSSRSPGLNELVSQSGSADAKAGRSPLQEQLRQSQVRATSNPTNTRLEERLRSKHRSRSADRESRDPRDSGTSSSWSWGGGGGLDGQILSRLERHAAHIAKDLQMMTCICAKGATARSESHGPFFDKAGLTEPWSLPQSDGHCNRKPHGNGNWAAEHELATITEAGDFYVARMREPNFSDELQIQL